MYNYCFTSNHSIVTGASFFLLFFHFGRSTDHVKNYRSTSSGDPYAKNYRSIRVFAAIGCLAWLCYLVIILRAIYRHTFNSSDNTRISRHLHSRAKTKREILFCMRPPSHPWHSRAKSSFAFWNRQSRSYSMCTLLRMRHKLNERNVGLQVGVVAFYSLRFF
jgi:hypothetical protein